MAFQFGICELTYRNQTFGCLQGLSLDFSFETAMLRCGSSLYPADIRTHTGEITGNAEFADLNAYAFETILGGTLTGSSMEINNASKPGSFAMVLTLITDGISFTITFPKVRSTKLSLQFVRDSHVIPNFDFGIEADTDGVVATIDLGDVS